MQQQISLYLDLQRGAKVDLETAARAALAFDAVLKELAFAIDPFSTVRVELESGTEGSLSLNSVIKMATGKLTRQGLTAIAAGVLFWFGNHTMDYTFEKVMDALFAEPEIHQAMSRDEIEAVATEVVRLMNGKIAEQQVGRVYQELQRDEAVKGVGVTTVPAKRPRHIVPRSEFPERGRIVKESEASGTRTETTVQTVTLVSPVLIKGKRKWKFRQGRYEFGAPIKDEAFLDRVLSGRESIIMSDGITMKVKITIKEEKKDGVWQIIDRSIDEVLDVQPAPAQTQGDLLSAAKE